MNQPSIKDFTDLVVYQKAYQQSLEIHRQTMKYPQHEQYELGSQMRVWARYSLDLGYIDESQWANWKKSYQDIAKMLNGLHAKWG